MNREKIAWLVSGAMIAILALQIPGSLAQRDDDYSFVRTLVDIHRQVAANYVDPVDETKLREAAIDGMLAELDPFTVYVPPARQEAFEQMLEGSFKGVGIQLDQRAEDGRIEVVTPIDGSPAFKAGVLPGDIILKVNGEAIENMRLPEVVKKIAGKLGSEVKLSVKHATGEEAELTMTREEIIVPTIKGYQRKQDNTWDYFVCDNPKVAYIRILQFTRETFDSLKGALDKLQSQGMQGLILDLRFNPGGELESAVKIVDLFIDHGTIVSTRGRNRPESVVKASAMGTLPHFPMIVIVNEHSASASEIVAGSLMDNKRALVIGERSYGKGSVQELIPLDQKGGELKLTVAYYYLPSGRLVHKKKDATDWGVQPQILVPMDAAAEKKAMEARYQQELFRKPIPKTSTQATTAPSTQAIDPQLQRAVDTMIAWVVFTGTSEEIPPGLTTQPATEPTTQPPESPIAAPPVVPGEKKPLHQPGDLIKRPPTTAPATRPK
jgi:carboxyl-terminal processing protease